MPASVLICGRSTGSVAASTTLYWSLGNTFMGAAALDTTEAWAQTPFRTAGQISNLWIRVTSNDRGASTYRIRINGAYGNASITVGASLTGEFSDAVSVDNIAVDDLVCCELITGAGGASFVVRWGNALFTPTDTSKMLSRYICHASGSTGFSTASTTWFMPLTADMPVTVTTESTTQATMRTTGTLQSLSVYISANPRTTDTVIGTRKNGAAGGLSVTIGAGLTGLFTDYVGSDSLVSGDLSNLFITTGTGVGAIVPRMIGTEFITTNYQQQVIASASGAINLAVGTTFNIPMGYMTTANTEATSMTDPLALFTVTKVGYVIATNGCAADSTATFRVNGASQTNVVTIPATTTGLFESTGSDTLASTTDGINDILVMGAGGTQATALQRIMILQNGTPPSPPASSGQGAVYLKHKYRRRMRVSA